MERAPALCLLISLLAFYLLVPSSAVPLSRLQKMPMQKAGQMPSVKGSTPEPKMKTERFVPEDGKSVISERMAFETQDYGPPVPNNHHKPPGWR
ncbi:hypothetical protein SEVIR_2G211400v4 [Setaria viridis]|uniref:CLAVATA3/ESR-related protein n=2 Tax=Setaria TaxID=4554 RepID=K3ZYG7_SETIT|nr:uncharacterized protein LOC101773174 [Setaria italica]XP_034579180.1 uncharacterized protein LOC117842778 [Setaria viridis]RCV11643.1 hypothetical protein SETIT_2G203100v2 [Setaria italica]TKW33098.1 hypothetical protein SEVIR_2G211400v2 [Setaria viridis]